MPVARSRFWYCNAFYGEFTLRYTTFITLHHILFNYYCSMYFPSIITPKERKKYRYQSRGWRRNNEGETSQMSDKQSYFPSRVSDCWYKRWLGRPWTFSGAWEAISRPWTRWRYWARAQVWYGHGICLFRKPTPWSSSQSSHQRHWARGYRRPCRACPNHWCPDPRLWSASPFARQLRARGHRRRRMEGASI